MKTPNPFADVSGRLALTRYEAARTLGISASQIDKLTKRGLLKPSRATRRPLYPVQEIVRFLRDSTAHIEPEGDSSACAAPAAHADGSLGLSNGHISSTPL